jgi:hypothetical protein
LKAATLIPQISEGTADSLTTCLLLQFVGGSSSNE